MKALKAFDAAIALSEDLESGYTVDGRTYSSYLSNTEWDAWISRMSEAHRRQFDNGSGGELVSKNGRPPKMASFASSSRMIYKLSRDIPGFRFEKQLPTRVGGIANLDGYLELERKQIYVEAKCREPYSHAALQTVKQSYKPLYTYLREKMPGVFSCVMEDIPNSRDMRVAFFCKGRPVRSFDIKQMICHMLGIANDMLHSGSDKSVLFLYLLFNPYPLKLSEEYAAEIVGVYGDLCRTASAYAFPEMYGHIVDYLIHQYKITLSGKRIDAIKKSFRFLLTDQAAYRGYITQAAQSGTADKQNRAQGQSE